MDHTEIDRAMAVWRQGDCTIGGQWFVHRCVAGEDGVDLHEEPVEGFAVLTQTCDVVRTSSERPFFEVSPLVAVAPQHLREIAKGYRPRYAYVPALESRLLVVDLDRVMTVEKRVAATWPRTAGCRSDDEVNRFQRAIGRKRTRFAFPDDFTHLVRKLMSRLQQKHGVDSPEGRGLRALREIRVQASPSWDANEVSLLFWFIRDDVSISFEGTDWAVLLEKWLRLMETTERFTSIEGQVTSLELLTADDYVHSDILDLDHLSGP